MKTSEQWITEIENQIKELKKKGRHSHYIIMASMTDQVADIVQTYLKEYYDVETRKCNRCADKWDFIITWT